jgi:HAD superfamily 5'-nucleotidase-like hydrolase
MQTPQPQRILPQAQQIHSAENHIPLAKRVFVNRNLKMQTIRMIGFDMDHTLAVYKKRPFEELAYRTTLHKLIEDRHYPESIAQLQYDPELTIRGLVVDKRHGNILKADQYNYVTHVSHGIRGLSKMERRRLYRNRRVRLSSEKYMSVDTLFGLPEATLFAQLVHHFEAVERTPWKDYTRVYDDVRASIDQAHADGSIKKEVVARPETYVERDPSLAATLESFRARGKKLFLLTNSEAYYTETVMSFLLDGVVAHLPRWTDYFDHVIVSAGKPRFYHSDEPAVRLSDAELAEADIAADAPPLHRGGGTRALEDMAGIRGDEILYVGDHTFGDILRAKKRSRWRTAMVVEELVSEIEREQSLAAEYQRLDRLVARRDQLVFQMDRFQRRLARLEDKTAPAAQETPGPDAAAAAEASTIAEEIRERLQALDEELATVKSQLATLDVELDSRFNRNWGKLFKSGEINSRFGQQVKDFACIYTSAVQNFLAYPESMYFRSPREIMPHEMHMFRAE